MRTGQLMVLAFLVSFGVMGQSWTSLGPWSTAISGTEAVISWMSKVPTGGWVEFWDNDNSAERSETVSEAKLQHVRLVGLKPGTRYSYKVVLVSGEESSVGFFTTPPDTFAPFTFLVYGDTQLRYDWHQMVADQMASGNSFAFVVHLGDLVETPTEQEWEQFFISGANLLQAAGFYCVIGNHERNAQIYYDLFELPKGGGRDRDQWWALWWGDVLLIGLDSNLSSLSYGNFSVLAEETSWLEKQLAQPARWKFVFLHHPLYSSGPSGENRTLIFYWGQLFEKYKVTAVFSGHDHLYEHIVRNDIHYFVAGGGACGNGFSRLRWPRIEGSISGREKTLHYLRVEVNEKEVNIYMVPIGYYQNGTIVPIGDFNQFEIVNIAKTGTGE